MAPRPDLMSATGQRMLLDLPPWTHEDPEYRAIAHAHGRMAEELDVHAEALLDEAWPATASEWGIARWEELLELSVNASDSLDLRRDAVGDALAAIADAEPSERAWIAAVSARLGSSSWGYSTRREDAQIPAFTIGVRLPSTPGTDSFRAQQAAVREETPYEYALIFSGVGGFILDASQLDVEQLAV